MSIDHSVACQNRWVEHDPETIYDNVKTCIESTVTKMKEMGLNPSDIKSVGITNQRETTIAWSKVTGRPLHHAIGKTPHLKMH